MGFQTPVVESSVLSSNSSNNNHRDLRASAGCRFPRRAMPLCLRTEYTNLRHEERNMVSCLVSEIKRSPNICHGNLRLSHQHTNAVWGDPSKGAVITDDWRKRTSCVLRVKRVFSR